ncbi:hypothetical protein ACOTJF_28510 [Achromobacter ruhlandii]|uniref:hypothetical protein n=1 Tax=Achromobacter ruhlandii TaxID=72557 RepID=UPI003BA0914D
MARAKINQIIAVRRGETGVAVVALDEFGQAWSNYSNNVPGGESGWNEWHKLPPLPEGSSDPFAQMK